MCRDFKPLELDSEIVQCMIEVTKVTLDYYNTKILDGKVCNN